MSFKISISLEYKKNRVLVLSWTIDNFRVYNIDNVFHGQLGKGLRLGLGLGSMGNNWTQTLTFTLIVHNCQWTIVESYCSELF